MNRFASALTLVTTFAVTAACSGQHAPASADTPPPAPATADAETTQKAETLLSAVAEAYRNAPALTDTVNAEISGAGGQEKWKTDVIIGPSTNGSIIFDNFSCISTDGKLYVLREDVTDKYMLVEVETSMDKAVRKAFGEGFGIRIPLAVALRSPDASQKVLDRFAMGMLDKPQITGLRTTKDDSGRTFDQIAFSSTTGTGIANIDPQTRLVHDVKLTISPPGAPEGFSVNANYAMNPQVHERLPTPITFDPGTRSVVDTIKQLQPKPLAIGDKAPDFTLKTLEGETVTLSELKGSVVVVDFWARWCGPCRMALPHLQKFAEWAKESGKPVKVYAVDVWEREKTDEEKLAKTKKFWTDQGFTMPTLIDMEGASAQRYGVSSIPRTFVIGPDGVVRQMHVGFAQTMTEDLKKEALELLAAGG